MKRYFQSVEMYNSLLVIMGHEVKKNYQNGSNNSLEALPRAAMRSDNEKEIPLARYA